MSPRAQRLHETGDRQSAELTDRLSAAGEAALGRPCRGRAAFGDGTVAAHTTDNYHRMAQFAAGRGDGAGPLRQSYERIAKRRGKQIATVAVARHILTLCFYGLRDGEIRCLAPRATARAVRTPAVTA